MRIVDLFSGTGGWTLAARERGHDVLSVDIAEKHDPDILMDVKDLGITDSVIPTAFKSPHVVLASPPCKAFSMGGKGSDPSGEGSGSDRWEYRDEDDLHPVYGPRVPTDQVAQDGCDNVISTLDLIEGFDPLWWWIENPRGGLRTMKFMEDRAGEPTDITYCRYGEQRMKPTDLWGEWPATWSPRPKCKNGGWGTIEIDGLEWRTDPDGFPCHHSAPRGAQTGTQGLDEEGRYRIPFGLSWDVCRAVEVAYQVWEETGDDLTDPDSLTQGDLSRWLV